MLIFYLFDVLKSQVFIIKNDYLKNCITRYIRTFITTFFELNHSISVLLLLVMVWLIYDFKNSKSNLISWNTIISRFDMRYLFKYYINLQRDFKAIIINVIFIHVIDSLKICAICRKSFKIALNSLIFQTFRLFKKWVN